MAIQYSIPNCVAKNETQKQFAQSKARVSPKDNPLSLNDTEMTKEARDLTYSSSTLPSL